MLGGSDVIEVVRLREVEGLGVRAIAKRLGLSRNTVRKYLREPRVPVYGPRSRSPSKLAPFEAWLTERTQEDGVWNSVRLHRELRERGYVGGKTILKDYLRPLRPPKTPNVVVRYEVPPGVEAQVDFGVFAFEDERGRRKSVLAFVMVLSFSRALYVEFVQQQDLSTLLRCHLHAFEAFGGVPQRVLYDNMKTVVLERDAERVVFHPRLLDFALLAGFTPKACRPYRAQSKGRVERSIKYLRDSFWPVNFTDLVDLNRQVGAWVAGVANVRDHGTLKRRPIDLLAEERSHLLPLKATSAFAGLLAEERKVGRDAFVAFEGSRYAVPWRFAGRHVSVAATEAHVEIRDGRDLVVVHPRGLVPGLTLPLASQYAGAPMAGATRPGRALSRQVLGPEVERRSLAIYDAIGGGA
jgi:transposase